MGDWLAGELHADVRDVLLDPSTRSRGIFDENAIRGMLGRVAAGDQRDGFRLWSLYMLETWQREFLDRAAPAPAPAPAAAVSSA
jgi:hypothetical protein